MRREKNKGSNVDLHTIQSLPVAAALFDDKKVYFINDKAAKLFSIPSALLKTPEKINLFTYLSPEFHKRIKNNNKEILKGKTFPPVELEFKDYKGKKLFLEIISNKTFLNGKKVIQSTFTEITERKKTEDLLRDTKEKFELITNNANDIICFYTYLNPENYLYVSPNIKRILGFKPEELLKDHNFFNNRVLNNKKEFLKIDTYLKDLQKRNIKKNYTYLFKVGKKNGQEVWLENNLTPITDQNGKIRFFLNVIKDITEQKEKEILIEVQNENYKNLIDNAQVAYVIHHNGIIIHCNNELLKILHVKDKKDVLGKFATDFFIPEDRKRVINRIKEVYKTKKLNEPITYFLQNSLGEKVEVEIRSTLTKYNNSICILSSLINISKQRLTERDRLRNEITEQNNKLLQKEIAEKKETEKKLILRTGRLTAILENTSHLIWSVDRHKRVLSYNRNFSDKVLEKYGIHIKEGDRIDLLIKSEKLKKEYIETWYPRYDRAFKGEGIEFERFEKDKKNNQIYRQVFINPIYDNKKKVTEVSCIAHDITEAKVYEQKLKAQSAKLNSIFESSHHYIWSIDTKQRLTSFNKNYFDLVANIYNTKPFIGLELNRGILSKDKEYNKVLEGYYNQAFKGKPANFELETLDKNLHRIYLDIFLNPIFENNVVVEVSGIAHDVTEKKTTQQKIEQSLKEKEVLLKEVHHRVKNNMQVISSILNLQSSYVSDEYTLSLLKESQNRIKTMAYIHESLYQNKSFTSVNFSAYVSTLVNNIIHSYELNQGKVKVNLDLDKINLSLDNSIPAGLIINELVTNALKHAFKNQENGHITISLKSKNNTVYLEVKDDGSGLNPNIDVKNTNTLGLQLVNALVDQMEAKVDFQSEKGKGTSVVVTFKM